MRPQAALAAIAALTVAVATTFAPASASRASYVIDDAHMLSATAIAQINQQVGDLSARTGKEVLVVTTDSLGGTTPQAALERSFAQNQVNGVEIFIAKSEKQIKIAGDRASRQFFPNGSFDPIYQAMKASFKQGNYDEGVETGVGLIVNTYRGHEASLNRGRQPVGAGSTRTQQHSNSGGFSMGWIWWIIILAVIFFVIRGIFRAIAGPRGGYGPGYGGGGYGPGYGGGGGFGGGGGGFWSGMLGGLGGAFLGNELFGNRGGGNIGGDGGSYANTGSDPGAAADASGWQSDAGQIDTSNTGGGGWGDSGGGDSGGGGWSGGDSGGGGGDSGGGW